MEYKSQSSERDIQSNTFAAMSNQNYQGQTGQRRFGANQRGPRGNSNRGNFQNRGQIQNVNNRGHHQSGFRGNNRRPYRRGRGQNRGHYQNSRQEEDFSGSTFIVSTTNVNNNLNYVNYSNSENNQSYDINESEISFLLDSGCSSHIVNNDNYFENFVDLKKPVIVYLGDGGSLEATKIGTLKVTFDIFGEPSLVTIKNVYYVKNMRENLLSFGIINKNNNLVSSNGICKIYCKLKRKLIAIAEMRKDNIYEMRGLVQINKNSDFNVNSTESKNINMTEKAKWHRKLGHANFQYIETLCKNNLVKGMPNQLENIKLKCITCMENKSHS